jgi:hypothetical protein
VPRGPAARARISPCAREIAHGCRSRTRAPELAILEHSGGKYAGPKSPINVESRHSRSSLLVRRSRRASDRVAGEVSAQVRGVDLRKAQGQTSRQSFDEGRCYHQKRDVESGRSQGKALQENPGEEFSDRAVSPPAAVEGGRSPRRRGRYEGTEGTRTNPLPKGATRSGSLIGVWAGPHPSRTQGSRSATQRSSRTRRSPDSRPG